VRVVVERHIFYNNSAFDTDVGETDDDAIASDKTALLPGKTATFANYTSYGLGMNGIMVDIGGPTGEITAADFEFRVGNDNDSANRIELGSIPSVDVRQGQGVGGSDRVTIVFDDNVIQNEWLQVTVLADNLGLAQDDVFYFGNAIGESGNSAVDAKVNAVDVLLARNNPRGLLDEVPIDFRHDYNRDGRVNATDMLIARENQTHLLDALKLISVPGGKTAVVEGTVGKRSTSEVPVDWLYDVDWPAKSAKSSKSSREGETGLAELLAVYEW